MAAKLKREHLSSRCATAPPRARSPRADRTPLGATLIRLEWRADEGTLRFLCEGVINEEVHSCIHPFEPSL